MRKNHLLLVAVISLCLLISSCQIKNNTGYTPVFNDQSISITSKTARTYARDIPKEVALEVHEDLEVSLWASDSLVADPVAISIDEQGKIYYTSGSRLTNSEFDIRGHRDWMTASISFETSEDRRAFLRKTFNETNEQGEKFLTDLNKDGILDWKDLTVEKEQIWVLDDSNGDGLADRADLYLEDFGEENTDLANGVFHLDNNVYVAAGPHLARTEDRNSDGNADFVEHISSGYAVHIGFGAHGMSGITVGPAGRIWWGIGDIGANVIDKTGKRWKYPNRGVVVRSDPDGSNFEVFSMGVRNTHEFCFDKYGNLITEDNDGDHQGERERLVYLVDGSDTGWRINWQFGKYTDPDNNKYKVWMDEKMSIPRWDGQAAYFLPPIQNYVNGPTGMAYNPGTALSPQWYDHFFIAEFRGSPANSPIHAFKMKPSGASFELDTTMIAIKGALPTGLDWGPEGALYFGDWIDGWGTKEYGRLWKLDVKEGKESAIRQETKTLIQSDFSAKGLTELDVLMGHQDMRIRQKAQFELVKRGEEGYQTFAKALAQKDNNQLRRIHSIWGIAQQARQDHDKAGILIDYLNDADPEIIAQCAKYLGDVRYNSAGDALLPLVNSNDPRLQFFATEALGRITHKAAIPEVIEMLNVNNDRDVYMRHVGTLALSRMEAESEMELLVDSKSRALRIAAVVALRRMNSPNVAIFLNDSDDYIVAEAARAINDDYSITSALPDLANLLATTSTTNEVIIRRAINANLRVGQKKNLQNVINYAMNTTAPSAMRQEAIATLSTWNKPSVLDRVDGRYRGEIIRTDDNLTDLFSPRLTELMADDDKKVQIAAMIAGGKVKASNIEDQVWDIFQNSKSSSLRKTALQSLTSFGGDKLVSALEVALKDKSYTVRSEALRLIPESDVPESEAVTLFSNVLNSSTSNLREKQAALKSLGEMKGQEAVATLSSEFQKLLNGDIRKEMELDVIASIESQKNEALLSQLEKYYKGFSGEPLAKYIAALEGGDKGNGKSIFYWNEEAQCVRCHSIYEWGGDAGPGLANVGNKLDARTILESIVAPSATLSEGYAVASLKTKHGQTVAGYIKNETETSITIEKGTKERITVDKSNIADRTDIPSSMPDMTRILSKTEIRDLVAFLKSLKGDHQG